MFLTYFGNKNLSLTRIRSLYEKSDGMEIRITNDEYYKNDPRKSYWNEIDNTECP